METRHNGNFDTTAHLIDVEPVMILGCSNYEIMVLGAVGFSAALLLGLLLLAPFGLWLLSLPVAILSALGSIYFGGKKLGKAKEGKPNGYFNRALRMWLARYGLRNAYVRHQGYWRIRR
jgi:conjugative transfer region protein (TIGR03750 family)